MQNQVLAQNSPNEKKFLSLLDVIEGFDQAPGDMDASIDDIYYISQNMVHNSASFNLKQNLIKRKYTPLKFNILSFVNFRENSGGNRNKVLRKQSESGRVRFR